MPSLLRTDQLRPGMVVCLGSVVRTIDSIVQTAYVAESNAPIYKVNYKEGRTSEWGEANTGTAGTLWDVVNVAQTV